MCASAFEVRRGAGSYWLALVSCALLCALGQAQAQAEPQPQAPVLEAGGVQLSIPDCEGIPGTEIAKLVALELAPRHTTLSARPQGAPTRASVRCMAAHATITVEDPRRPSPLVLELALTETASEARPRFLALAVAELIATSRLEYVDALAVRQPPSPPPPAPPAEPSSPPPSSDRFAIFLEAGATRAFEPALFAPAIAAGLARGFAPFALIGDVVYERGQTRTLDAAVTAQSLSLSLAPAWQISARRLTLSLALGLRGGYAWLAGTPRRPGLVGRELSGIFLAPISDASLQLGLTHHWAARLALELGYVIKPVRGLDADQGTLLELRGLRLALALGMAFAF
jgi:hypothetical protein